MTKAGRVDMKLDLEDAAAVRRWANWFRRYLRRKTRK